MMVETPSELVTRVLFTEYRSCKFKLHDAGQKLHEAQETVEQISSNMEYQRQMMADLTAHAALHGIDLEAMYEEHYGIRITPQPVVT